jgi:hypothetical protein
MPYYLANASMPYTDDNTKNNNIVGENTVVHCNNTSSSKQEGFKDQMIVGAIKNLLLVEEQSASAPSAERVLRYLVLAEGLAQEAGLEDLGAYVRGLRTSATSENALLSRHLARHAGWLARRLIHTYILDQKESKQ